MNIEKINIEQILKTWAKVRREDEESFLLMSFSMKEDSFTLASWSKPIDLVEEEDEEGEEGDDREAGNPRHPPGTSTYVDHRSVMKASPGRPPHEEEEEEIHIKGAIPGSFMDMKINWDWLNIPKKGPRDPQPLRGRRFTPQALREMDLYKDDDALD